MRQRIMIGLLVLLVASCSSTEIDPFVEAEAPYTIWGYLDPNAPTQHLRVIPITRQAELIEQASEVDARLDAKVYLVDLETNFRQPWRHTLRANADSSRLYHVYSAQTQLLYEGQTHRIEVVGPEGEVTYAETTIPPFIEHSQAERGPLTTNDAGEVTQRISFPGIGKPYKLLVIYSYVHGKPVSFGVYYDQEATRDEDGHWSFVLNYTRDAVDVTAQALERLGEVDRVPVTGVEVRLSMPDSAWAEMEQRQRAGEIAQPGAYSNVVNGFGYFGSIGVYRSGWGITRAEGQHMGFTY